MAARGTESKNKIFTKLMEVYPDAFWEDEGKILRVPLDEAGTRVEIKIQLTAAKANLGSDTVASAFSDTISDTPKNELPPAQSNTSIEITPEEKERVDKLVKSLNLQF